MAVHSRPRATPHDVATFYEKLVFPSRTSHAAYAALVPQEPGERIGDFGCGQSLFYDALRAYEPAPVFLDLSMAALRSIDYGARVRGDLFHLPFVDGRFDRIFCIGVLHHLPEPGGALVELARVLRAGGGLVIGVYAPGTVQARLRRMHDLSARPVWRALWSAVTAQMIRVRYARKGQKLQTADVRARTRDFLEVPFVRYVEPDFFAAPAHAAGLRLREVRRISGMNLLVFTRDDARDAPSTGGGSPGGVRT